MRAELIEGQWRRLAEVLEREMHASGLRSADPYTAAIHFRGLVEGDLLERRLHGEPSVKEDEIGAAATAGVNAFLRAYAP